MKRTIYAKNVVREYWLVDPQMRRVTVFACSEDHFDDGTTYDEGTVVRSQVLPGLTADVRAIFGPA